ncbi:MAG: glutamate--tRNA ligase [Candidatus Saccharimonadaceae bacterium]
MMENQVRVRFAPSPTGPLHIGGVRTALYNYLFAKQQGGKFILRIEDTDSNRFVEGAEDYIEESFEWLNLEFDEGPKAGGKYGPYKQSERKSIYKQYVNKLMDDQAAYIAYDTPEELDAKRKEISNFQYDASTRMQMRNSLSLSSQEIEEHIEKGTPFVVRIKIEPNIEITVNDLIRGEVVVNSSVLDDKVIYKSSDLLPTYHLANIVDDHLMKITHVIRGEEWLPSAPLHVWMYKSFGWEETMPQFVHLPLLLKPEGNGKLSKRDGDRLGFPIFPLKWTDPLSGEESAGYRESGYLPDAVINFLALLGWNPGNDEEIISLEHMIELFSFDRCSKSGAKFDFEKGKWFNHEYIQLTSDEELEKLFRPILDENKIIVSKEFACKVIALVKNRAHLIEDIWDQGSFFFKSPTTYDDKTVKKRWKEETPKQLSQLIDVIEGINDFSSENQEVVVKQWIEDKQYHLGNIMNAFRLALVGEPKGPHIFDITSLIGKEESIKRLKNAISTIQ